MKKFAFWMLLLFILGIILFAMAEITFRIFGPPHNPMPLITQTNDNYLFEPNTEKHMKSAYEGEYDYAARINNFGYRGKDFDKMKPEGVKRIFVIGDSFTFGGGTPDPYTIPVLLEKALKEQGHPVEVINAGLGSTSPITQYFFLRNVHLQYDPDFVIVLFDLSDISNDSRDEKKVILDENGELLRLDPYYRYGKFSWKDFLQIHSAIFKRAAFIKAVIKRKLSKKYVKVEGDAEAGKDEIKTKLLPPSDPELDVMLFMRGREKKEVIDQFWTRTEKYLDKIKETLDAESIPMVLATYPYGIYVGKKQWHIGRAFHAFEQDKVYTDYYAFEVLEDYADKRDIPFVNTLPVFLKNPDAPFFHSHDGHLDIEGNKAVVEGILKSRAFQKTLRKVLKK